MVVRETMVRTWVRVATWRVSGVILGVVLTYIFAGEWTLGFEIGITYGLIRTLSHVVHERLWMRFSWGLNAGGGSGAPHDFVEEHVPKNGKHAEGNREPASKVRGEACDEEPVG